jgi:hypothetical protein
MGGFLYLSLNDEGENPLFVLLLHEIIAYSIRFFSSTSLERRLKEKEFKHRKHDEKFNQDDDPERFAPGHASKPFGIDTKKGFKCGNHIEKDRKESEMNIEIFT